MIRRHRVVVLEKRPSASPVTGSAWHRPLAFSDEIIVLLNMCLMDFIRVKCLDFYPP